MEYSVDQLIVSFQNFNITDNRLQKDNDITILTEVFSRFNISDNNDVDELINKMESMEINDDNVIVKMKDNTVFMFHFNQCRVAYNSMYGNFSPKWQDSY
ncbi:hypothetical protein QKU48_gp1262 [Fadolivirus algeromassiliense]|jgi:hypothetical protein|uniref:Uncharacterized protein n=1 Tax=Fadolivirus FV1/VV64 TaxID=3070911 RepID=A0A7D3QXT4_9VIRU|nr:hypothetical protein QKU48_gp1262 [Fadolivirus algeromassiliense]QKF94720.1 hypothetical protein Fadolivirus_1_1262 [Fadolivirus FV1/VV64]